MTSYFVRSLYGYSQQQLADRIGISVRTVQNWDAKGCMPKYVETLLVEAYENCQMLEAYRRTKK